MAKFMLAKHANMKPEDVERSDAVLMDMFLVMIGEMGKDIDGA